MSGDSRKTMDFSKEYLYVRRLISVLTNDNSDKMIVEKLKGKNLSSLLFNAKIIDSKNMAANKRILGCVIRAIEWEKHLCRQRDLEQSWARKLLASLNCLVPVKPTNNVHHPRSACTHRRKKSSVQNQKQLDMTKRKQLQSSKSMSKSGYRGSNINSSRGAITEVKMMECVKSVSKGDDVPSSRPKLLKSAVKKELRRYEVLVPVNLNSLRPQRILLLSTPFDETDTAKKTSSTQTFERKHVDNFPKNPEHIVPNNIRLQDLLQAASSLINTQDQREYVRSFLSNFEPPFDLSEGFPPYLKLPMNQANDKLGKESIYGSNSELSFASSKVSKIDANNVDGIREIDIATLRHENVKKYVRELAMDPWQGTAESIISGVINEPLPHDRADYSQLGACILKRLGALPMNGYRDQRLRVQSQPFSGSKIPEIILSCTEWFESDSNGENEKIIENDLSPKLEINQEKSRSRESIVEIKLLDQDRARQWELQGNKNFCFYDSGANGQKVDLLDLSDGSLVGIGGQEEFQEVQMNSEPRNDRKSFQPEPLTISPSGITPQERKFLKTGVFHHQRPNIHHNQKTKINEIKPRKSPATSHQRVLVEETKVECSKMEIVSESSNGREIFVSDGQQSTEDFENIIEFPTTKAEDDRVAEDKAELAKKAQIVETTTDNVQQIEAAELIVIPNPSEQISWEVTVKEIETFDGVGECHGKLPESPKTQKMYYSSKNDRGITESGNGQNKKCKTRKFKKPVKGDDTNRNCKVM